MVERRELPATTEVPFIDLIKDSWPPFQENWLLCTLCFAFISYVSFLVVGIPGCIVGLITALIFKDNQALSMSFLLFEGVVFGLAFAACYNGARVGWTKMLLQLARGEGGVKFADLKSGMPWFKDFFLTMLLIGVGTAVASIFLIVPGIIFSVRTALAPYLVIDENLSPMEALSKSNELVTGYSWQIFGYYCILSFANTVLGFVPIIQFALVPAAMAFFDLVLTRIYLYRKQDVNFLPKR